MSATPSKNCPEPARSEVARSVPESGASALDTRLLGCIIRYPVVPAGAPIDHGGPELCLLMSLQCRDTMPQVSSPATAVTAGTAARGPDDLVESANRVDQVTVDLRTARGAAHVGWNSAVRSGGPARAMRCQALVAKWRADSKTLVADVTDHGRAHRAAGEAYRGRTHLADKITSASDGMRSGDAGQ